MKSQLDDGMSKKLNVTFLCVQLEVEFDSLSDVEEFWASLPSSEHQAWSQRARHFIVDGTPKWEIYRSCPIPSDKFEKESEATPSSTANAIIKEWRNQEGNFGIGRDRSHEVKHFASFLFSAFFLLLEGVSLLRKNFLLMDYLVL